MSVLTNEQKITMGIITMGYKYRFSVSFFFVFLKTIKRDALSGAGMQHILTRPAQDIFVLEVLVFRAR